MVGVACFISCDAGYVAADVEEALQQCVGLIMQLQIDTTKLQGRKLWILHLQSRGEVQQGVVQNSDTSRQQCVGLIMQLQINTKELHR